MLTLSRTDPVRRPPPPPPAAPADDLPRGCGWFDSSHALQTGLQLTVHDSPDMVASLVPLSWWLQWELAEATPSVR
jgi:hypothetical protein